MASAKSVIVEVALVHVMQLLAALPQHLQVKYAKLDTLAFLHASWVSHPAYYIIYFTGFSS